MKKIITICAAFLITSTVFAQSPNKMSYQAVIRNTSNALVTSTAIGMRISILQSTPSGNAVYVETQTPTTNINGLASIEIGGGTVVSGNFATIDWANGPYFVKTETDPTGGTSYSITGTSQLLSVPYALYAANSGSSTPGPAGPQGPQGPQGAVGATGTTGPAGATGATGPQGPAGTNGTNGADGKTVLNGVIDPTASIGNNGDFYINTATNTIFGPKSSGIWPATGVSLVGPQGATGPQGPIGLTGQAGATGATGPQGPIGLTGAAGATGPQGTVGLTGATGPQGPAGTNGTNGADGKTVLNGVIDPTASIGNNGDFYINTATNTIFGPKSSGIWPATGVSLVGPQGATGPQGPIGLTGQAGATGATGPQGPIGLTGAAGATGPQGPIGLTGPAGNNGKNSLVKSTTEPAGSNCTTGGVKLEYGLDANSNGVLDLSEIDGVLTKYVCNGNSGTTYSAGIGIDISNDTISLSQPIANGSIPVGSIQMFAGSTPPQGWLLCDGSAISRSNYSSLFSVIGTSFGAGDGSFTYTWQDLNNNGIIDAAELIQVLTTFNLPDLRGRVPVGKDNMGGTAAGVVPSANNIGILAGEEMHQLSIAELPNHSFDYSASSIVGTVYSHSYCCGIVGYAVGASQTSYQTNSVGGNQSHNNMQPYLVLNYIIKVN